MRFFVHKEKSKPWRNEPSWVRKLMTLTSGEWTALISALYFLPRTELMLRRVGLQRTKEAMTAGPVVQSGLVSPTDFADAAKIARIVNLAAHRGLLKATCLTRSLVLFHLLQKRGMACELIIGAELDESRLSAHAWVELGGVVINDQVDIGTRFSAFDQRSDAKA